MTVKNKKKVQPVMNSSKRMTLNELCSDAHTAAKKAGWWDRGTEKSALECHMLIVSEVAEASEAVRDKLPDFCVLHESGEGMVAVNPQTLLNNLRDIQFWKPEGEAVELADAVIRIADWFGHKGWDMEAIIKAKMAYNATRGHRHGGKAL